MRSCGRRRSRGRGGEDGGAEGDAGRPASGGSVRRRTGTRRSSWAAPGGEGEAIAMATVSDDGGARVVARERDRGGEWSTGESARRSGRLCGVSSQPPAASR